MKNYAGSSIPQFLQRKARLTTMFALLAVTLCLQPALPARSAPAPVAPPAQAAQPAPAPVVPPAQAGQQQRIQPEAAFALMAGEAEKGNSAAMLTLGQFYEQGLGAPRNYGKALEWYEKAAQAGQAEGHYNVGVCFEIGMGAAPDMARAVQSFQKAADMGLAFAMYKLSAIHISGNGVPKDTAKGLDWLEKAANAGMAQAANELGMVYLSGLLGQKKDERKALAMFSKAMNLGNLEAVKNVAVIYKDGMGVEADPAAAYTWYLIARKGGYAAEDLGRVLGLLEASLSKAQLEQANKDADAWLENYAKRQRGGQ